MLVPWGRFSRHLRLSERLRAAVAPRSHEDAAPGGDLVLGFGLASLAGYAYLEDLNLGAHPLAKDQAVQDAWDIQFRHYTTVSRFLYELDESDSRQVQAELEAILQPYIRSAVHEVLCQQAYLTLYRSVVFPLGSRQHDTGSQCYLLPSAVSTNQGF